jgi:hypothetical protein
VLCAAATLFSAAIAAPEAAAVDALPLHARSVGTPEVIRGTRSLRITGRVQAIGLPGTFEALSAGPGNLYQSLDLGVVALTTALDRGENAWTLDANGKTRSLDGEERREIVTESFFTSLAYLETALAGTSASPSGDAVPRPLVESLAQADDGMLQVAITPAGGRRRILAIDPETGRLVRSIDVRDIDTVMVLYGDYREVDGLTLPYRVQQTTGDPAHDVVMEIDRIERNAVIDAGLFRMPQAAAADFQFEAGDRAENIAIEMLGAHIVASVKVNGRGPYRFFLDTGAGATCIDEKTAQEQGLESVGAIKAEGVAGSITVSYVRVDSLALGSLTLLSQKLVSLPLSDLPGISALDVRGILGYDFFSRFVVRIDYANSLLSVYAQGAFQPPADVAAIPILLEGNVPSATGMVNGSLEGAFRIDTGSGSSLDLHAPFVSRHRLLETATRVARRPYAGIGGMRFSAISRLESFALGPHVIYGPIVGLSESTEGVFASSNLAGNIGGGILRRFMVTFDYEAKVMYLEPNANFADRDRFDRSGLVSMRENGVLRILRVEPDSPAWKAGLRDGDEILAVNGRAASKWDEFLLADTLIGEPGKLVSVRYRRGSTIDSVQFRLEEIL